MRRVKRRRRRGGQTGEVVAGLLLRLRPIGLGFAPPRRASLRLSRHPSSARISKFPRIGAWLVKYVDALCEEGNEGRK